MAATKGDFDTLRSDINDVTNTLSTGQTKIADRIERLTAKLAEGGMSPEEETAALEALRATVAPLRSIASTLDVLGTDPTTPVPDVPPVDVPPVEGEV
jgi:DNA anti-recombination protein RmuC